jgi:dienelactone hydrolase
MMHVGLRVFGWLLPAVMLLGGCASANGGKAAAGKNIKMEEVSYQAADGTTCRGYVAYDASRTEKRGAVLVVPEWWGCNDYARMRANMLAELGYIAMAVDMYGEGKQGNDPAAAQALATPFYQNPSLAMARMEAAKAKLMSYPQADPNRLAAIGYCFGGSMVLNAAALGLPDLKGVVSFHGGLGGLAAPKAGNNCQVLVCHGLSDSFISPDDISSFKGNYDRAKVSYQFLEYPDATHAFTNPDATANGKTFGLPIAYNEAADKKSWQDMQAFLARVLK